jgi:Acetyltransferase (GNAT) domain
MSVPPGVDTGPLVRELTAADVMSWTAFVSAHPDATLYHTLAWRDVVQRVFGHTPCYLLCERAGTISGVLPMFRVRMPLVGDKLVSMPYDIGAGGPLAADEVSERVLVEAAMELARSSRTDWLECRTQSRRPALDALGLRCTEPVILSELLLEPGVDPWKGVSADNRQSVRKAQKRGVAVREAVTLADYEAFYQVYLVAFRNFGTPPYGHRYFPTVFHQLQRTRQVRLFLALVAGEIVGGLLLYCWGRNLVSKFAAVTPEAVPLRAFAALYGQAIDCAVEEGARRLSWGTASRAQAGLIDFKERWGGQSHPAAVYCLPVRRTPPGLDRYYDDQGLGRRIWRHLPLTVTATLGGALNRWFC